MNRSVMIFESLCSSCKARSRLNLRDFPTHLEYVARRRAPNKRSRGSSCPCRHRFRRGRCQAAKYRVFRWFESCSSRIRYFGLAMEKRADKHLLSTLATGNSMESIAMLRIKIQQTNDEQTQKRDVTQHANIKVRLCFQRIRDRFQSKTSGRICIQQLRKQALPLIDPRNRQRLCAACWYSPPLC